MSKSKEVSLWNDKNELTDVRTMLKEQYGSHLTDQEFGVLCKIGQATGLNPFMGEIYALKYGEKGRVSIFVARDGYRRSAQAHPAYQGHTVDAVHANDEFRAKPSEGEVSHDYAKGDRGPVIGAYCIVHRKGCKPMYTFVEIAEYYSGQRESYPDGPVKMKKGYQGKPDYPAKPTTWDEKPATMIKKVAEAHGLRGAFQELFGGTYEESEKWDEKHRQDAKDNAVDVTPPPANDKQKPPLAKPGTVARDPNDRDITATRSRQLFAVWNQYVAVAYPQSSPEDSKKLRQEKLEKVFGVSSSSKLGDDQAAKFIERLKLEISRLSMTQDSSPSEIVDAEFVDTNAAAGEVFGAPVDEVMTNMHDDFAREDEIAE